MASTFRIDTTASPSSLLARARRAAIENGAALVGSEPSGRFSHEMVKGEYLIIGRTVVVTVTDKHWLLPWSVVQAHLRRLMRNSDRSGRRRPYTAPENLERHLVVSNFFPARCN